MYLGLGLRLGGANTTDGTGGGSGITAPVLARTSSDGSSPLTWTTTIDSTVYAGYFWRLQIDQTSSAFGAVTQDISQMITPSEIAALDGSFPTFTTPGYGPYWMRIRVEIDDGASGPGSGTNSAWSNVLTDSIIPVLPRLGSIKLWTEAADLSTMFQLIAGTTAANADGDPVGYWADKSGNGNHLTALANTGVRPTHKNNSGIRRVSFDGTDDILRRMNGLGLFANGSCTVMLVCNSAASQQGTIFSEGYSAAVNPLFELIRNNGSDFKDSTGFIRNDSGTVCYTTTVIKNDAWPVNTDSVYILTDSGSLLTGYLNNSPDAGQGYSRTAPFATGLDTVALGARFTNSNPGSYAKLDVYAIVAWTGVHSAQDRIDANNYGNWLLTRVGA